MCALLSGLYIGADHEREWGGGGGGGGLAKEGKNVSLTTVIARIRLPLYNILHSVLDL